MKTITIDTYTITELKDQFPDGFKAAFDRWQNKGAMSEGTPWQEETIDSLKACISAAGLNLRDWNLGAYNRGNFISVELSILWIAIF